VRSKVGLIRFVWLVIAVCLAGGSVAGGDTSIVCGYLLLIWTIPFDIIWQFYLSDLALKFVSARIADWIGLTLVIAASYIFWFVLIPRLFVAVRPKSK
jgi:hypothetical protein